MKLWKDALNALAVLVSTAQACQFFPPSTTEPQKAKCDCTFESFKNVPLRLFLLKCILKAAFLKTTFQTFKLYHLDCTSIVLLRL